MSLVQLIECTKCGNGQSIPYDPSKLKMPWEVWTKGCPKCGCSKVDVTIIHDKSGIIRDAKIERKTKMSCSKCCFYPCDQTSATCGEGVYWIRDKYGNIRMIVELSEPLKSIVERSVLKALESEG